MLNDPERLVEFELCARPRTPRSMSSHWLGRGEKEKADAAACDAIYGIRPEWTSARRCVGRIKDNAPGIFVGKLGNWTEQPALRLCARPD
jgi:fructose-1,6-bisphosphatase II